MTMTITDHLVNIASSSAELLLVGTDAPDRPVPACPSWTVTDLLHHVGSVYLNVGVLVKDRPVAGEVVWRRAGPTPPPGPALLDWFRSATDAMMASFQDAHPEDPAWSWSPNQTVGFWIRRMSHEVAVHVWDAGQACGRAATLPARLADDGVDEFLTEFVPLMRRRRAALGATDGRYVFVSTDTGRRWSVQLADRGSTLAYPATDVRTGTTVQAAAAQLLLLLWGRVPAAQVEASTQEGLDRWFTLVGCP
jgi:uncharacterized protein (TIGR03083 family)